MKHHPEQNVDEIYMGTIEEHTFLSPSFQIWNIWQNKRLGNPLDTTPSLFTVLAISS